ncbi:hypothetical protein [Roseburia sp. 1XD42-34]|uniref:hypothetical protein n=1 Tax=Roseburia sp. 1XD42-34 TaxID=2305905 RepID=UPI001A9C003C|nr:hypothetical protein [Roseburia sp. 1XD42-34]
MFMQIPPPKRISRSFNMKASIESNLSVLLPFLLINVFVWFSLPIGIAVFVWTFSSIAMLSMIFCFLKLSLFVCQLNSSFLHLDLLEKLGLSPSRMAEAFVLVIL